MPLGTAKKGDEKLMDRSVQKEECRSNFVRLSEFVCEYRAWKNCFQLAVYSRISFSSYCPIITCCLCKRMGRFGVVQTSCTNRRGQAILKFTDETFKPRHNLSGIIVTNSVHVSNNSQGLFYLIHSNMFRQSGTETFSCDFQLLVLRAAGVLLRALMLTTGYEAFQH